MAEPTKAELQEMAEDPGNAPRVAQIGNFERKLREVVLGLETRKFCISKACEIAPTDTEAVKELTEFFYQFISRELP